ncbi:MAG TPA: tRNA 2-thiouridine(34) synthase MnmA [Desulfatiglandales bacterium]|nr:tRNA 2-thiouridine(34) synthase MnmA [Desulfatiglandales bacterium]
MNSKRVIVAMSGGVDSSVAAAILKEEGYQVIGVTMQIWPPDRQKRELDPFGGCCGVSAVEDAKRVAYKLNIPHYVLNFRDIFFQKVITPFCQDYSLGRTPNPCIKCNQYIKFGALLRKGRELGASSIATGHYARVEKDQVTGRYALRRGFDRRKDQSYFLYPLTQDQLKRVLFPVGDHSKEGVREIAGELGLSVAAKPESQEICFIPHNDYPRFLREHTPPTAVRGPIVDRQGDVLGEHQGIPFYTIGQRKRLGISSSEPLYVIAINPEENSIVVGSKGETYGDELIASHLNWISINKLEHSIEASVKIRYLHEEAEATITPLNEDKVNIRFKELQMAITPGQAAVFYEGDTVIGGGTIERAGGEHHCRNNCSAQPMAKRTQHAEACGDLIPACTGADFHKHLQKG